MDWTETKSLVEGFTTRDSWFVMSVDEVGRKLPRVDGPRLDIYVRIWAWIELIGSCASKHRMGRHEVEREEGRGLERVEN